MDETFTFIAPVMPKRAVHPMAIRAALISSLFVASVGALGVYVVQHEQAADARRAGARGTGRRGRGGAPPGGHRRR